jgi:RND family efflux transporter MFP subunit
VGAGVFSLLAVFALSGCGQSAEAATQASPPAVPIAVSSALVQRGEIPTSLRVTGTLRGERETDLAANAAGRVLATSFERGAEVSKGALLARLDTRAAAAHAAEASASVRLARVQKDSAQRECDRYAQLLELGAIPAAERDRVADQCRTSGDSVAAAEARAASASLAVIDGQIRAPFAGVVSVRHVEVGQYVRQDSPIATIVSLDPLRLEFSVPEADVAQIKAGGAVRFEVPAYPGRTFDGEIRFVDARVRAATRDLLAEATVKNPDRSLRPGMFASVALTTGTRPGPVVPTSAIVRHEERAHVFVVAGGKAEERVVQLGEAVAEGFAVKRGLGEGDVIVTAPPSTLRNGQAVR